MPLTLAELTLNESQPSALIYSGYVPGCLSTLCAIQSEFYAREWGFNHIYESVIANGVSEFLSRFDDKKDFVRLLLINNQIVGGITIDHKDGTIAQLRWFIISDQLRGSGVGKKIFNEAMSFVRDSGIKQVYLTTFQGLDKARYLYESAGFTLTEEKTAATWGKEVIEQRFYWYA
jgi:N-acetylglutamate synthase-like GNAT family acetyltransferase